MDSWRPGFYPFWFWNDTLSADEIEWQVQEMAKQGIRGFFIHCRQGLGQPYLSESFLEMVDVAVEAAEAHGLSVHLYDEYPYPSGIAGGEVVLGVPEFQATRLVQRTYDLPGGHVRLALPRGKVLACRAYRMQDDGVDWAEGIDLARNVGMVLARASYVEMGLTAYNRKRFFASQPTPVLEADLPAERYRLFASVQAQVDHHKYWDHYVDVLNPQAMREFIALTHERYLARYGQRFGKTILSIFTDEIRPHWSARIPAAFEEAYGYELCPLLPALQDESHPAYLQVCHDLDRLTYRLFCESYEEPVSAWCKEHGLAYTGEKPSLRMSQLRYMDVPGCEPGHTKVGAKLDLLQPRMRGNAKATASAAYFYGKIGSLCECYHSTGWSATLQDAKFIADALLLMGTRYLVPHGFFYSTHGLRKHDAPPTFFFQMPFWPFFGELSAWVSRVGELLEGTHIDGQVLVVEPTSGLPRRRELAVYEELLWALMGQHIDFHVVDTDVLESAAIEGGQVWVADIVAEVVVVPPMRLIESSLQQWLDRYREQGGQVLLCSHDTSAADLCSLVTGVVEPSLSVRADDCEAEKILTVKRVGSDRTLWYLLNTGGEPIEVELDAGALLREVSLGKPVSSGLQFAGGRYRRLIAPYEALMLAASEEPAAEIGRTIDESPSAGENRKVDAKPVIPIQVGGPAAFEIENANLLRMGEWYLALLDEDGEPGPSAVVPAMPLPNQLERGRLSFVPAYTSYFGHVPELSVPLLHARYAYTFECAYDGPVWLLIEPDSIGGEWRISLNGHSIGPDDLGPAEAHVRGTQGLEITRFLVAGENCVYVDVSTDHADAQQTASSHPPDGGLLNPLHLAGSFGVEVSPPRLVPLPERGEFEAYDTNKLPYYAGAVTYHMSFELDRVPGDDFVVLELGTDRPFHEASEVSVNGSPFQPVLWQPRCLELPAGYLRRGSNEIVVRVYTTLARAFEGQWFDYRAHEYRQVGEQSSI